MKLPRDISGVDLAKKLAKYGYGLTRQRGSHMRLATDLKGKHLITIPAYKALPVDVLDSILADLSEHLGMKKSVLINELFE